MLVSGRVDPCNSDFKKCIDQTWIRITRAITESFPSLATLLIPNDLEKAAEVLCHLTGPAAVDH